MNAETISIPLSVADRAIATRFANQQLSTTKARQVYLNTLAILAVKHYLHLLSIPADLSTSESWNPADRLLADLADLHLAGVGRLECRPIRLGESMCRVPPDSWNDRLAYLVVALDRPCHSGTLMGFVPALTQPLLPITELKPLSAFLAYLYQLQWSPMKPSLNSIETNNGEGIREGITAGINGLSRSEPSWQVVEQGLGQVLTFLGQGWQAAESLLTPSQLAFRSYGGREAIAAIPNRTPTTICRGKVLDLGLQLGAQTVALLVELSPDPNDMIRMMLQVHPIGTSYLPANLQLAVLNMADTVLRQVQARTADNYIQLELLANIGEQFQVQVSLNQMMIVEQFLVQANQVQAVEERF